MSFEQRIIGFWRCWRIRHQRSKIVIEHISAGIVGIDIPRNTSIGWTQKALRIIAGQLSERRFLIGPTPWTLCSVR
ncbi:Uncharacterised protein [Vibrio cholerae]|nr:Uncharacterised protein [Vibrio cholerae]CSB35623.1 Uncharacterised protein [Vibrio cholerae]